MNSVKDVLKKNTMLFILLIVVLFFGWKTNGVLFDPQNVTNLIAQNGHVVILAVGMLLCILTGGNIDLSVGSVVAFIGTRYRDMPCARHFDRHVAGILDRIHTDPVLYRDACGNAPLERRGADHLRRPDDIAVSR